MFPIADVDKLVAVAPACIVFTHLTNHVGNPFQMDGHCLWLMFLIFYNSIFSSMALLRNDNLVTPNALLPFIFIGIIFNLMVLLIHVDESNMFRVLALISTFIAVVSAAIWCARQMVSWSEKSIERLRNTPIEEQNELYADKFNLRLIEVDALRKANRGRFPIAYARDALRGGLQNFIANRQKLLFDHFGIDADELHDV